MKLHSLFLLVLALPAASCHAQLPSETMAVSGVLKDSGGTPATGARSLTFRIYRDMVGGMPIWEETQPGVSVDVTGRYSVRLGITTPLDPSLFDSQDRWLSIEVNGDGEMSPRLALSPVPYSHDSALLDGSPPSVFAVRVELNDGSPATTPVGWNDILGVPIDVLDGDDDTTYTASAGIQLLGSDFSAVFAGTGAATTVARSDHDHSGLYAELPVLGMSDGSPPNVGANLVHWDILAGMPPEFADGTDDVDDADSDPTNELQTWATLPGIPAEFADGTDDVDDADSDPTNELQTWATLPGIPAEFADGTDDVDDADSDPTNELQTWATLPGIPAEFADGTDDVDDADSDPTNELQTWATLPGIPAEFADGTDDVDDADSDPTNELQTWATLPGIPAEFADGTDDVDDADSDPTNERNTSLILNGSDLELTDSGGTLTADLSSLGGGGGGGGSGSFAYPDGVTGTPITRASLMSTPYVVPAGQNLYINIVFSGASWHEVSIDGTPVNGGYCGVGDNDLYGHMEQPLVVAAGQTVSADDDTVSINGFLTSAGVTPVTRDGLLTSSYVVPAGKTLVVTSCRIDTNFYQVRIDGITVLRGFQGYEDTQRGQRLGRVLLVAAGQTVSATHDSVSFNGYLRP